MAKLKLIAAPTFKATVKIPEPGGETVSLEMTFKHRTRDQLAEFLAATTANDQKPEDERIEDPQFILQMAVGWELSDPFDEASLELLVQNHIAAPRLIFETYLEELTKARAKN